MRAEDDEDLRRWLKTTHPYTSPDIQNELLEIISHAVLRQICSDAQKAGCFGVVADGTQDVQGTEQMSICIRYITQDFEVIEDFLGLYALSSSTGECISKAIQDALIRLQLDIMNLRAQTYDGASNMSGCFNGCQAEIKKVQELALYVHCGAHVTHLIASKMVDAAPFIRDALDATHELGKLYNGSGKFKQLYLNQNAENNESPNPASLKPICPTRWLTRTPAVNAALKNYSEVINALDQAASSFGNNVSSRANVLSGCLSSGKTLLGLYSAFPLISTLEAFNRALQGTSVTVGGLLQSVNMIKEELQALRTDAAFDDVYQRAEERIKEVDINPIKSPRRRKVPKKFHHGNSESYTAPDGKSFYRQQYFSAIDSAQSNLNDYFDSTDLAQYRALCEMLTSGEYNQKVAAKYPELKSLDETELAFFRRRFTLSDSLEDYRQLFKTMEPSVRSMFPNVEKLLRLLLISPASSCVAERSFSALRRVKTWLRSTMGQERLNCVMVSHVHKERLADLDCNEIARAFIMVNEQRKRLFGLV